MKKILLVIFSFTVMALPWQRVHAQVTDTNAQWKWVAGTTGATNTTPVYTAKGTPQPATSHYPGTRAETVSWTDTAGNLWLFSGCYNLQNHFNDVWKYNPNNNTWTWMNGEQNFGTAKNGARVSAPGVPDAGNMAPGRESAAYAADSVGNLWVFGGIRVQNSTRRNDLWKFDSYANEWTYLNGTTTTVSPEIAGNYGTKGVAASTNQPGARGYGNAVAWIDHKTAKFYMFGGSGAGNTSTLGILYDFWEYNMNTGIWTWIGGGDATTTAKVGIYGTKGVASSTNYPQARQGATRWTDNDGNFWMFGGATTIGTTTYRLNDLWKYTPSTGMWTWMHGDSVFADYFGVYGQRGVPNAANKPGGRSNAPTTWVDANGKLWMYGGYGWGESGTANFLSDMWRYDPVTNEWAWMFGSKATLQAGTYTAVGSVGTPGGKSQAVGWVDRQKNFWIYGGQGTTTATATGFRSDLWKLEAVIPPTPTQPGLFTTAKPSVCAGESNVIYSVPSVSGATSYDWEYNGTNATFTANTVNPTNSVSFATNATGGTLRVRAVGSGGSSPWRDTTITVNALPTVTSTNTGNLSICAGDSLLLTASGTSGVSYRWKESTTNIGIGATYYAKTAGSYTVTATDANNCSAVSTPATVLQINTLPTVTSTNTGARSICAGDSLQLTASGSSGVTYQWKQGTTNIGTGTTYYAKTAGSYTVTATNANNCSATSTPATVLTVNALPTVSSTNTGTRAICAGDSLLLTASGTSGVNYLWKEGTTNVGTGATYYARTAGTYTVTATNANNCSATSTPATTLTVNTLPVVSVTAGGPVELCTGGTVTLTATQLSGTDYQWKDGTTPVGTNTGTYTASATGSYKVVATTTATGCADSTQPLDVFVYNRPGVTLVPGDTAFCEGGLVILEVESLDTGLTYLWKNGGTTVPLASAFFLEITETGDYTVEVGRASVAGCDTVTNEVTVTVHPLPVVDVTWDGETLHATPGYASYQWNTGGQGIIGATNSTFIPSSNGVYSVTAMDENGCSSTSAAETVTHVGIGDHVTVAIEVQIYPNPAKDVLYIKSSIPVTATLSSMDGRLLQQQTNVHTLYIGNYADGVYLLRITDSNGFLIRNDKVLKQH